MLKEKVLSQYLTTVVLKQNNWHWSEYFDNWNCESLLIVLFVTILIIIILNYFVIDSVNE